MATSAQSPDKSGRSLVIEQYSYAYPEAENYTLRDISLVIRAGECHLLEGPTGSGKSTLLLAIRGLLPHGRRSGNITLFGADSGGDAGKVALIQQNPDTQLLHDRLGADIAFGLENRFVAPELMPAKVAQALGRAGLEKPLDFPVESLSMGQRFRACVAGQLVLEPTLVLLDEPVAQLDPSGRVKILQLIRQFKDAGVAVLISEHRPDLLRPLVDHSWVMTDSGRLLPKCGQLAAATSVPAPADVFLQKHPEEEAGRQPVIEFRDLTLQLAGNDIDLSRVALEVYRGECVVLHGPNGSGKTTLIRTVAGLVKPQGGVVRVLGREPSLAGSCGRVSVLFQNPARQLFETTVFAEVAFAARRSGMKEKEVVLWVELLLEKLGIGELAMHSSHKLSYGQKHLVGFAAVLAGRPEVVLLDDPFAGLDRDKKARVQQLLSWLAGEWGMTVIWTTHDPAEVAGWSARSIELKQPESRLQKETPPPRVGTSLKKGGRGTAGSSLLTMPTGAMLLVTVVLSTLAFAARSYQPLLGLLLLNLALLLLFATDRIRLLRKSVLFFSWQSLLVVLLYGLRFGYPEGVAPGLQVAGQLFLAFWPGMIFMSANSQAQIARTFSRILPYKTAFVATVCLRFLPTLLYEMQQIREVQILRGARLSLRDLKRPGYWPDWLFCLTIPTLIATLSLAAEIATAAAARDFGCRDRRTTWPGE